MQNFEITPFNFNTITLSEVIQLNGIPHITRKAIGEWLEYADPQKAVDNILERNTYINTHSVPLKLRGTDGKNYDTFVYHPIGFLLIVMESSQPKAKEMKQAVAEFVWHFSGPQTLNPKERLELQKMRRTLVNDIARTKDAFCQEALLNDLTEISMRLGLSVPNQHLLGKRANQLEFNV